MFTKEQKEEFEKLSKLLIKWLNDNSHPHSKIIIETDSAELVEGSMAIHTTEFILD